jgi:HPt (histidine-containing phosphotransfer) domain-containing protein
MTDKPIIDQNAIDRLKEWGGDELPRKMIDIFLSHSPERMEQIREGLSTATPRTAETGAHSLKSSAGNVGAVRVQELAQVAESLAEAEDMEELKALLPNLEEAFTAACQGLEQILEGMDG